MLNENLPRRKVKLKIALPIIIAIFLASGLIFLSKYWLGFPTASLLNGAVADQETTDLIQERAQQTAELVFTYAAGDSPVLINNLKSQATEKMQKKLDEIIAERQTPQTGTVQTATFNNFVESNIHEQAAVLKMNLTVTKYVMGLDPAVQTFDVTLKFTKENGVWLLSALSPNKI